MLTAAFAPGQKKDERIVKLGNGLSWLKDGGSAVGCRASTAATYHDFLFHQCHLLYMN